MPQHSQDICIFTYIPPMRDGQQRSETMEDVDVYFPATPQAWDDLTITHTGISVIQSTDYYPGACLPKLQRRQGLVMREEKNEPYRFGYQGQFAEKDEETGWNHFELRQYDSRIGRWLAVDPQRQYFSPYQAFGNNPMYYVDPDGAVSQPPIWFLYTEGNVYGGIIAGFSAAYTRGDAWDNIGNISFTITHFRGIGPDDLNDGEHVFGADIGFDFGVGVDWSSQTFDQNGLPRP